MVQGRHGFTLVGHFLPFGRPLPPCHWVPAQMSPQEAALTTQATEPASFPIKAFQILALFSIGSAHSLRAGTRLYSAPPRAWHRA